MKHPLNLVEINFCARDYMFKPHPTNRVNESVMKDVYNKLKNKFLIE